MQSLYQTFTQNKSAYPDQLNLRLHRALSWLDKAHQCGDDKDMQFISLWIAFNAIYAKELGVQSADRASFTDFIQKICRLDEQKQLYGLIWQTFSQSIRIMLDNPYVFQPFWDYQNGKISELAWQEDFSKANKKALNGLKDEDTATVLMVIFDRLYTLRNQIVHGGATYKSSVNREQLGDGCQILKAILPVVVGIVLNNPNVDWGKPFYPVV